MRVPNAQGMVTGASSSPHGGPAEGYHSDGSSWMLQPIEVLVVAFVGMICAPALWAYVTAKFVDIITTSDPDVTKFRQNLEELNRFCIYHNSPTSLAQRMRLYLHETRDLLRAESRKEITDLFSPKLQYEAAWVSNK